MADRRAVPLAVVAVVAGAGFEAIYRDFGVNEIVRGGPAANPSTRELLTAIRNVDAQVVILLPNHLNVVLAARQAATLAERPVHVVPTRNAAEGVAALLVLDPAGDVDINVDAMTRAARQVQTLAITEAVRDSTIAGRAIKQGQTMALDPDDGLVVVDSDPGRVVQAAVASLQPGYELLTIYHGDGSSAADAEALAERLRDQLPRVEVEVVSGGQRLYRYLIAAE